MVEHVIQIKSAITTNVNVYIYLSIYIYIYIHGILVHVIVKMVSKMINI